MEELDLVDLAGIPSSDKADDFERDIGLVSGIDAHHFEGQPLRGFIALNAERTVELLPVK